MIERLLPDYVACAESEGDDSSATLLPEEAAAVGRAVEGRIREFTTARSCARRAMARFGVPPRPILSGPRREPLWPDGYVGSITHCDGYRAAAVARRQDALAIGIDAEPHAPLPPEIVALVTVETERTWLGNAPTGIHWDRLLFSAKESVYKAWYPLTHAWLGFHDVLVTVHPGTASFHASLLVKPPQPEGRTLSCFAGHFLLTERHVLTAVALSRELSFSHCAGMDR